MHPVLNNTKWDEIRLAMYGLGPLSPKWRTRDRETGYVSEWDGEWFYHFRAGGYESIEWVDIRIDSPAQEEAVRSELKKIHVPGCKTEEGFRVFGYQAAGVALQYL